MNRSLSLALAGAVALAAPAALACGPFFPISYTDPTVVDGTLTNADFRVGSAMKILGPISVRDYEQVYGANNNDGTAAFNVHGTFKPAAGHNYFYGCTMQNGSTIDLSSRTGALPLVSSFTKGDNTLKFAAGTIHVKLGERNVTRDTCLISWSSKPSGIVSTRFASAEGERRRSFIKKEDGLYVAGGFMLLVR